MNVENEDAQICLVRLLNTNQIGKGEITQKGKKNRNEHREEQNTKGNEYGDRDRGSCIG